MSLLRKWFAKRSNNRHARVSNQVSLQLEPLEDRSLLSVATFTAIAASPSGSPGPVGFTPIQVRNAYGIDGIRLGGITGDGANQTIAIIDAYDNPNIVSDLHQFDTAFGLPDPPTVRKVDQDGSSSLPGVDPAGPGTTNWESEESIDVEWAHAVAPQANIILVEANSDFDSDLIGGAANWARQQPGVSVVSMSFGVRNGVHDGDSYLATPTGHNGVTFVASSGDRGAQGDYPASSPSVLAVGGTTLTLGTGNTNGGESAWHLSGGGISTYSEPAYQNSVSAVVGA
jgi:subtilase family serine protease